jgi:uncharacterized membrane protein YdbT with pleckstrin-like domain
MATTIKSWLPRIGVLCRTAAVALIAGVCPGQSVGEVNSSIVARPIREQTMITVAVLAALFVISFIAAQFGWIGILLFWLGVIFLVN